MDAKQEFLYRQLSNRQLQEIVDRIQDQIDNNPEKNDFQIKIADEARTLKSGIEAIMNAR